MLALPPSPQTWPSTGSTGEPLECPSMFIMVGTRKATGSSATTTSDLTLLVIPPEPPFLNTKEHPKLNLLVYVFRVHTLQQINHFFFWPSSPFHFMLGRSRRGSPGWAAGLAFWAGGCDFEGEGEGDCGCALGAGSFGFEGVEGAGGAACGTGCPSI